MVVRTGLRTTMGDMLRRVIAPVNDPTLFRDPFVPVCAQDSCIDTVKNCEVLVACVASASAHSPAMQAEMLLRRMADLLPVVVCKLCTLSKAGKRYCLC